MSRVGTDQIECILRDYQTIGPVRLSEELGLAKSTVVRIANSLGVRRRKSPVHIGVDQLESIRTRYVSEGPALLAFELGISEAQVGKYANRFGLKTKVGHKARGRRTAESNTSVNIRYFRTWSQNMAYVLGFSFADGTIDQKLTSLAFTLHQKDLNILTAIREDMESTHKLSLFPAAVQYGRNAGPRATLSISSKVLVEDLVNLHGLHPAKSTRDDPFPFVPDPYLRHFIRGFFDGDGTVAENKRDRGAVGFCGTRLFIHTLHDLICRETGLQPVSIQNNPRSPSLYSITWQSDPSLRAFYNFFYPEGEYIYGGRKKAKLEDLIQRTNLRRANSKRRKYLPI